MKLQKVKQFKTIWIPIVLIAIFIAASARYITLSTNKNTAVIVSDVWLPYSGDADTMGYMTDIVIAILKKENIKYTYTNYAWNACLEKTNSGSSDIIIGISENNTYEVDNIIKTDNVIGTCTDGVVSRTADNWQFTNLDSMFESKRLGYISGYFYSPEINELLKRHKATSYTTENASGVLFEELLNSNIDAFIEDYSVYHYAVYRNSKYKDTTQISNKSLKDPQKLYIGFTNTSKGQYLKRLIDNHFEEMLINGEIEAILKNYNLTLQILK